MPGVLDGVARLMAGDADRRDRGRTVDPLRQRQGLGRRVVVVGEHPLVRNDLDVVDVGAVEQRLSGLRAGATAGGADLGVLGERRTGHERRHEREPEGGQYEQQVHRVEVHSRTSFVDDQQYQQVPNSAARAQPLPSTYEALNADAARVAVVTGGTRGIGRAIVEALLAEGWSVWPAGEARSPSPT